MKPTSDSTSVPTNAPMFDGSESMSEDSDESGSDESASSESMFVFFVCIFNDTQLFEFEGHYFWHKEWIKMSMMINLMMLQKNII